MDDISGENDDARHFRSVLPHEPLPSECPGYVHMQGAFTPKRKLTDDPGKSESVLILDFWSQNSLQSVLLDRLNSVAWTNGHLNPILDVHVIDPAPPFTKVSLVCESSDSAHRMMAFLRIRKLCPHTLFAGITDSAVFGSRPFQLTQMTTLELPPLDQAWNRSNPPKFRRLLPKPGEDASILEDERMHTRFVFVANLLISASTHACWGDPHAVAAAVRDVVACHDTSRLGAEVFVSHNKLRHCHVGMRSPQDARALIAALQDKQVKLTCVDVDGQLQSTTSGRLFLDYAAITYRSFARAQSRTAGLELEKGEPERSECTSTTAHISVPGLIVIPDFCSTKEEETLVAVLMGPHAPWAPSQSTPTDGRVVRRKVQHYGYVFDYKTANVLRDRQQPGADCPAMPALPDDDTTGNVEDFVQRCAEHGNGWDLLAVIIERARRFEFGSSAQTFPFLNQLTVNTYEPGEGIGSHVDTPSAFGDGLISISLNGGIVMEFRGVNGGVKDSKKLVYLPPRSLVLMSGPARYEWEHMIVTRTTDTVNGQVFQRQLRVSLTMRTALDGSGQPMPLVASSRFPPTWGSDDAASPLATPACERDHVHSVYDAIATQWHHTRGRRGVLWPGATQFLQRLEAGSVICDVGCGDGKYFPAIWEAGSYVIGTDISLPLLKTATMVNDAADAPDCRRVGDQRLHLQERPAVAVADCMSIPIRTNSCDAAICIAVLHHISTPSRRKRCIEELARIVKPGGTINIQAWAIEQEEGSRHRFAANDVFVPFKAQPKYLTLEGKDGTNGDSCRMGENGEVTTKSTAQRYSEAFNAEYDDHNGLVVFKRYCHLYKQGELEGLCQQVPNVTLIDTGFESGNHFVILEVLE